MDFSLLPLPPTADLYPHVMTRYRRTETRSAAGAPTGSTVSTATGVRCHLLEGVSIQSPQGGFIRDEADNQDTADKIRFASDVVLQPGDVLLMTTGPKEGKYWEIRGDVQYHEQVGRFLDLMATRLELKYAWVP